MLPDYKTCIDRIKAYNQTGVYRKQIREISTYLPQLKFGFKDFWEYKTEVEKQSYNILDPNHLSDTASKLHDFLDSWGMRQTKIAESEDIEQILNKIRPYYNQIQNVKLGSGQMCHYRKWIEAVYEGIDGITNLKDYPDGSKSYITGKSKFLLAIWGQTPGFDSLTKKKFLKWNHQPFPTCLRHLGNEKLYKPSEFFDMIVDLDEWVLKWPENNGGRSFTDSFNKFCIGLPVGRIIDQIYNWKFECEPLKWYLILLKEQGQSEVSLSFKELEEVLSFALPEPAFKSAEWWKHNLEELLEEERKKPRNKGKLSWVMDKPDIQGLNIHFFLAPPMINDISSISGTEETTNCIAITMAKKPEKEKRNNGGNNKAKIKIATLEELYNLCKNNGLTAQADQIKAIKASDLAKLQNKPPDWHTKSGKSRIPTMVRRIQHVKFKELLLQHNVSVIGIGSIDYPNKFKATCAKYDTI